jgi:hypothetical protein
MVCKQNDRSRLAASQIYTALPVVQTARPPVRCCDVPTHPILPHAHACGPCPYPCEPCHGLVLLHTTSDGCAEPANHRCWPRPRHTGRMADRCRRRADCSFPTAKERREEETSRQEEEVVGEAGRTASHFAGRTHAYPPTIAQNGIVDCSRPDASRERWLLWVMPPGAARYCQLMLANVIWILDNDSSNGVDTQLCAPVLVWGPPGSPFARPRVHLTLALGRREGAGTGHAHALQTCRWADLAPNPVVHRESQVRS